MEKLWILMGMLVLTSGCICCCTNTLTGIDDESVVEEVSTSTQPTPQQTTLTTMPEEPTTTMATTTTVKTQTTATTVTTTTVMEESIAECVKKKGVDSDEVIFLYTSSCCGTIANTVSQLGSYKFQKYELGISITSNEKYILDCLGIEMEEVRGMQAPQFWCPGTGEQLVIPKEEFIGAKERIRDFAIECKQSALENE